MMSAAPAGQLASFGQRALGYLIDMVIVGVPVGVLYGAGIAITASGASVDPNTGMTTGGNAFGLVFILFGWLVGLAIQVWNRWMKGGAGQTIGKRTMGITLVSEDTGRPIGTLMAFVRDIAHIVDSIICGLPIGWLSPLWDAKRQTWADKIVKTVVVVGAPPA